MSRICTSFGLLLLVVAGAAGCRDSPVESVALPDAGSSVTPASSVVAGEGPPKITFDAYTHDFGRIPEIGMQTGHFDFTNAGGEPLVIESVKATCGCTVPTLERMTYAPGERGRIDIVFDPTGPGKTKRYINVLSNAADEALVVLDITADVEAFLLIEPRMVAPGPLAYGKPHRLAVTVTTPDPQFTIERVTTTNPLLRATRAGPDPAKSTAERRFERIDAIIDPKATWGGFFSWIEVTVRGRPTPEAAPITHSSRVRVMAQLFGNLYADPDTFRFGVQPDEAFERTIRLYRPDGVPFRVLSTTLVDSNLDGAQVVVKQLSNAIYELVLTARGAPLAKAGRATLMVTTDVPGEERIPIPVIGVTRDPSDAPIRSKPKR